MSELSIKIVFLIVIIYAIYEVTIDLFVCKYKYKFKRYRVLIRVVKKSPKFIFPFSIGTGTGALLVILTATSWSITFLAIIVATVSLDSSLKAYFKINLRYNNKDKKRRKNA